MREIVRRYTDVPFHVYKHSIIFRRPLGNLPEMPSEGCPGWALELSEHTSEEEVDEALVREKKDPTFWTE